MVVRVTSVGVGLDFGRAGLRKMSVFLPDQGEKELSPSLAGVSQTGLSAIFAEDSAMLILRFLSGDLLGERSCDLLCVLCVENR